MRNLASRRGFVRWGFAALAVSIGGAAILSLGMLNSANAWPDSQPPEGAASRGWPLFRGDPQAQGVAATTLPDQPSLVWKRSFPKELFEGAAAIENGVIYLGGAEAVYALQLSNGEEKWRFKSEIGFKAAPAVRNGLVYIGDLDGKFHCLDAATGKSKWEFAAQASIDSGANFYKDKVLFGSQDATLYCLNAASGEVAWKHAIADQIRCFPTIVQDRAFVAGCDGALHIIDLEKGEAVAQVKIDAPTGCTPAVVGDRAFVGTEGEKFLAIDWKKQEVSWSYTNPRRQFAYRSSAAATKDVVVVGNQGKLVLALDPATGKELWIHNAGSGVESSPVIVGSRAFVGTTRGVLLALNLADGKLAWQYETGGSITGSPAVADGKLVIGNDDGDVYCFGAK